VLPEVNAREWLARQKPIWGLVTRRPDVCSVAATREGVCMVDRRCRPGEIRDAIVGFMEERQGPASVAEIRNAVSTGTEEELGRLREEVKKATEQAAGPRARVFGTMLEVLDDVPAELRPQPKPEWYKYTEGKFCTWWKEQLVGMEFERKLVVGKVNAMRNSMPRPGAEWTIFTIPLSELSFTYLGAEHRITVTVPGLELD
jgi:hypothetical protein